MAYFLSGYEKKGFRLALLLLVLLSPLLQAAGLRSPEAVAQAFAAAYRSGDVEAIVALQFFADDSRGFAAANRERERRAWLERIRMLRLRSYRVDVLLARDLWSSTATPLPPQKKLVVEYESQQQRGRIEESYLIGWQGGAYYLLPVHDGRIN